MKTDKKSEAPFKETRKYLGEWFKESAGQLKKAASSFVKEAKTILDEARKDYEEAKKDSKP